MSGVMDRGGWKQTRHKRSATRVFYEGCGSISTGFMSKTARDNRRKKLKKLNPEVEIEALPISVNDYTALDVVE